MIGLTHGVQRVGRLVLVPTASWFVTITASMTGTNKGRKISMSANARSATPPQTKVIDISHYQSIPVSLEAAAAEGVRGVVHKCTQGNSYIDNKCAARWYLAKEAGLLWGLYHYLNPGSLRQQVDHFWRQAQQVGDGETLLCLDYEEAAITLPAVADALGYLAALSGRSPVLYSGHVLKDKGGAAAFPELANYRLWLAQYGPKAVLPAGYTEWWLWQFTDEGSVAGVAGNVDCNAYTGMDDELAYEWPGVEPSVPVEPPVTEPEQQVVTVTISAPAGVTINVIQESAD
jgi:lysozyme